MTAQQLKNSILKLAISGKLVPQDPNDEPASVLIEKIRKEKDKLIKEGKIKKEKNPSYIFRGSDNMPYEKVGDNEPVCIADEVPFEIPEGWEWCRLSYICSLTNGEKVNNRIMNNLDAKYLRGLKKADKLSSGYLINKNDIMILVDGENSGEIFVSNEMGYQGSTFKRLDISAQTFNKYVLEFIRYNNFLLKKKKIGAAIPHLNKNLFFSLLFPLPPLQEQQRIVTEIEKYLPLINEYDKLQTELDTLDKEFPEKLKKSILKQAIKGKLVEQDPSDEPASILLEKIREEKEKLIKEGKIKKDKNESIIYKRDNSYYEKLNGVEKCIDDEIPFEIPGSWEWCRLNSISYMVGNKYNQIKSSEIKKNGEIPVVSQGQLLIDGYSNDKSKIINDIPLIMFGDHTKNVKYIDFPFVIGADGTKFHKIILCENKYIYYWMIYVTINITDRGYARHHSLLLQEFLPLPPLAEQQRIVAEIEKYLLLINEYN